MEQLTFEESLHEIQKRTKRNHLYTILLIIISFWTFLCLWVTSEKWINNLIGNQASLNDKAMYGQLAFELLKTKAENSPHHPLKYKNKDEQFKAYEKEILDDARRWSEIYEKAKKYYYDE